MTANNIEKLIEKANNIIGNNSCDANLRESIKRSLDNLLQTLSSEANERFEFLQHPDMQEQLDAGLPANPDIHPCVEEAAKELISLMEIISV